MNSNNEKESYDDIFKILDTAIYLGLRVCYLHCVLFERSRTDPCIMFFVIFLVCWQNTT